MSFLACEVRYASGNVVYGVPFNGSYIAEYVPALAVADVSNDPNILPRLQRYALGLRSELAPEAKKARAPLWRRRGITHQ
jgi:hypothetical protein